MNNKKGNKKPFFSFAIILLIIVFGISSIFLAFGCEETPPIDDSNEVTADTADSSDENNSETQESQSTEETGNEEEKKTDEEESESAEEESSSEQESGEEQSGETTRENNDEMISIDIYYADAQVEYLVGEKRQVKLDNKFVNTVLELIKSPENKDLISLVPPSTVINKIVVRDNIADVDLSANFIDDRFDSATVDILLIYSIVNTLTGFPEVDAVIFYINGVKLKNLGSLDVEGPIFRRNDLIKN